MDTHLHVNPGNLTSASGRIFVLFGLSLKVTVGPQGVIRYYCEGI